MKSNPLEPRFRTLIGFLTGREKDETLDEILTSVSKKTKVSEDDIKSKSRKREVVEARHIFCYLAKASYKIFTLNDIGQTVSRDHSTVSSSIQNVQNIPSLNKKYHELYG